MNKLKELFRQHRAATIAIVYVLLIVVAVVIAIVVAIVNNDATEIDPASQMAVVTGPTTNGPAPDDFVGNFGFDQMVGDYSSAWVNSVRRVIRIFANENDIELQRISVYAGSYHLVGDRENPFVAYFKIALNVDEVDLDVEVSYTRTGILVKLFNMDGELLFERATLINQALGEYVAAIPDHYVASDNIKVFFTQSETENGAVFWSVGVANSDARMRLQLVDELNPPEPSNGMLITISVASPADPGGQSVIYRIFI